MSKVRKKLIYCYTLTPMLTGFLWCIVMRLITKLLYGSFYSSSGSRIIVNIFVDPFLYSILTLFLFLLPAYLVAYLRLAILSFSKRNQLIIIGVVATLICILWSSLWFPLSNEFEPLWFNMWFLSWGVGLLAGLTAFIVTLCTLNIKPEPHNDPEIR